MVLAEVFPSHAVKIRSLAVIGEVVAYGLVTAEVAVLPYSSFRNTAVCVFGHYHMVVACEVAAVAPPVLGHARADLEHDLVLVRGIVELKLIDGF